MRLPAAALVLLLILTSCTSSRLSGGRQELDQEQAIVKADQYLQKRGVTWGRLIRISTTPEAYFFTYDLTDQGTSQIVRRTLRVTKSSGRVRVVDAIRPE